MRQIEVAALAMVFAIGSAFGGATLPLKRGECTELKDILATVPRSLHKKDLP